MLNIDGVVDEVLTDRALLTDKVHRSLRGSDECVHKNVELVFDAEESLSENVLD